MAEAEVLTVNVAVCAWPPVNENCFALNVLVPGGPPKEVSVTGPVKPLLGVSVRL